MSDYAYGIPYGQLQRLRLIDFLLGHYGMVNRSAVVDFHGVSTPQASIDFQRYIELAPDNLHYDQSARAYVRSEGFVRVWT